VELDGKSGVGVIRGRGGGVAEDRVEQARTPTDVLMGGVVLGVSLPIYSRSIAGQDATQATLQRKDHYYSLHRLSLFIRIILLTSNIIYSKSDDPKRILVGAGR
jgi:hypothetical protein